MSTAKQRIIVLAGLVALLIAAPIVNYAFNNSKNASASKATTKPSSTAAVSATDNGSVMTGSFFSDYVTQRDKQRTDEVTYLDSIINNSKTDADTLKTAQKQKEDITAEMEKELSIESLLKAKGFSKVAAVYHIDTHSVNIIVGKAQLTDAEVAQILDVAIKETSEPAANIKIIPAQ